MHTSVARLLTPRERKEEIGTDKAKKKGGRYSLAFSRRTSSLPRH